VKAFSDLLERLLFTPGRSGKIALLRRYFATVPDPDRGYGLAVLTGELDLPAAKPALIRALAAEHTDPELFALSYDYVGDLAETVALMWPGSGGGAVPSLCNVVTRLRSATKPEVPVLLSGWLDAADASQRLALLKLITGGLRVGLSARLARVALASLSDGRIGVEELEEIWHGQAPPYRKLFAWLEGRADRPGTEAVAFRPLMLAHPLEDGEPLDPATLRAEWKWDGIRVQLAAAGGQRRLYSRGAEDISATFPDLLASMDFDAVLDGELLVLRDGEAAPFADLQQRLNRKTVPTRMLRDYPAWVRLYDILFDGAEDLRALPFDARRTRLESWFARTRPARMDLSALIQFTSLDDLAARRDAARAAGIEGLMLKRADAPYVAGRVKGLWWKWKRDPLTLDTVLMYAQRGHGRRSSYYSDYTFGVWRDDGALVPVGKAYSGFSDAELAFLDRWVREHTTQRYGPVREVEPGLVLEVAFDAAQASTRHKSGVALRFPRIARIRRDKPIAEADRLETVLRLAGINREAASAR
jgi:DNA ligase-1